MNDRSRVISEGGPKGDRLFRRDTLDRALVSRTVNYLPPKTAA